MGLNGKTNQNDLSFELTELIPGYLNRRDEDVLSLKSYISSQDFKSIKMLGHKLKGNGSSFGFERITELGTLLMQAADAQRISEVMTLVNELQDFVVQEKSKINL